jgi:hypothetical protein
MNIPITYFKELKDTNVTWDALKDTLVSNGLRLIASSETPFVVARYVKESPNNLVNPLFRSVIFDSLTNTVVSFAPSKAVEGAPPVNTSFTHVEDFVDGCMLQVFMTANDLNTIHLATRSQIGAMNAFYSKKTFAQLFEECLANTPIRNYDALKSIMSAKLTALGARAVFGSFVIQHPEHRVVYKYKSPDLSMVHFGWTAEDGTVNLEEDSQTWDPQLKRLQIPRYPVESFSSDEEYTALMRRTAVQNGFLWQGLVFKDGKGNRWRTRSTSYMMLRTLRGAEATSVDRFLRLRKAGKIVDYLKHYSEERDVFWTLETALRARTNDILKAYEAFAKMHSVSFAQLPPAYKPGVHMLHALYLATLRAEKVPVRLANAISIVNSMKTFEQRRLIEAEPLGELATKPLPDV